jgi:hypothetical protein
MIELSMLSERLSARADSLGLTTEKHPSVMHKTRMRAAAWADANEGDLPDADLPKYADSLFIGNHAVLLGDLGVDIMDAQSQWHRFMNQAAIARSWLPSEASEDLNLFFVGPVGSDVLKEWRDIAARIERDDRVCRKLVWLPPTQAGEQKLSLDQFLSRTFLARPWKDAEGPSQGELDQLSSLGERLAGDDTPGEAVEAWLRILRSPPSDNYDLVQQLTEVIPAK